VSKTRKDKPSLSTAPGTVIEGVTFIPGGLGAVKGLRCAGVAARFRRNPRRRDLALVVCDAAAVASGVFTKNSFCAAPVNVSRDHLQRAAATDCAAPLADGGGVRAVILNSGNANAATGEPGRQVAIQTAQLLAEQLGCQPHQVLLASTGVIGNQLPIRPFLSGIPAALAALGKADGTDLAAGLNAAQAIMTTDTVAKQAAVSFTATQSDGVEVTYRIGGMAKGSGMIQPDMATLLGVLATDALLTQEACDKALREAIGSSFNKVTVDSDTSTNDSIFLLATGATPGKTINASCPVYPLFVRALRLLCEDLARQIAHDGEGATRLVTVNVAGAATETDADKAARAVANSPLVKTAIAGHDANWGRIAMALGKSGASFRQEDVDISIMGLPVCRQGLTVPFDEEEALRRFEQPEIVIDVDLGAGSVSTRVWTCDLTHEYVSINGDYRT
jgi:glutamate N-acetyltransferase/amino-acid N-acetyltransferase